MKLSLDEKKQNKVFWAAFVTLLLVFLCYLLYGSTKKEFWYDEMAMVGFVCGDTTLPELLHTYLTYEASNLPLYAVLLWPLVNSMLNRLRTAPGFIHSSEKSLIDLIGAKVIASQLAITNFPNMVQDIIMEIWRLQADLDNGMDGADNLEHILANKFFRAGVDFMRLRAFMDDSLADACESWEEEYEFQSARALMFRKAKESLKKELKKSGRQSRGSEKTKTKSRKKRSGKDKMKGGSRRGDESLNLTEWM